MEIIRDYTVVDLEMTGLAVKTDKVIEIGAARVRSGKVVETFSTFIDIEREIPPKITQLTGITNEMIEGGMKEDEGMEALLTFIGEDVLVGQNFSFDYGFIRQWAVNHKRKVENPFIDTLKIARGILPKEMPKSLEALCAYFQIDRAHAHRALDDAVATHIVFEKFMELSEAASQNFDLLFQPKAMQFRVKKISPMTKSQEEQIKKYRALHNVTEPIDWARMNRSEASRLMEHYYQTYGRN
ncbi:MAG: 3'-5' exonuclease [Lachnospiraceae bacterium]|nr:3'-5' exonuclease [Lachnospiraceae bacterium]